MTSMQSPVEIDTGAPAAARKRDPKLEGVRAYAATGVLAYHVAFVTGITPFLTQPGARFWGTLSGALTVSLAPFFVLSGLLLFRPFARTIISGAPKPAVAPFLWRRALRVLPGYWLVIVVVMLTINLYSIHGPGYFLRPILLVNFFWDTDPSKWVLGAEQTWTVSTEVAFYLLLPLLALAIGRYARRADSPLGRARRMLAPLGVLALLGFAWTAFAFSPSMAAHVNYLQFWPFGYFIFFAAGMALGTLSAYAETAPSQPAVYRLMARWPLAAWGLMAVVAVVNMFLPFTTFPPTYAGMFKELLLQLLIFVFAILLLAPMTVPGLKSRLMEVLLANPVARYLGRISYGIYIWHQAMVHFWFKNASIFGKHPLPVYMLRGHDNFVAVFAFVWLGSIACATISYFALERPILRRLRDRVGSRSAAAEPSVALAGRRS